MLTRWSQAIPAVTNSKKIAGTGLPPDNEEVSENRNAHSDRQQQTSQPDGDRYEQGDSSDDFDQPRHGTKPLTQANMVEDLDHHGHAGELGTASRKKRQGSY